MKCLLDTSPVSLLSHYLSYQITWESFWFDRWGISLFAENKLCKTYKPFEGSQKPLTVHITTVLVSHYRTYCGSFDDKGTELDDAGGCRSLVDPRASKYVTFSFRVVSQRNKPVLWKALYIDSEAYFGYRFVSVFKIFILCLFRERTLVGGSIEKRGSKYMAVICLGPYIYESYVWLSNDGILQR